MASPSWRKLGPIVAGATFLVVGAVGSASLMVALHMGALERAEREASTAVAFERPPERKKPIAPKPKPKPKPKRTTDVAPPAPMLGAALSGMSFDLPGMSGDLLGGAQDELLGAQRDVIMTEDSVDDAPRASDRAPCAYPPRARAKHIQGSVTLSLLVRPDGTPHDVVVADADPTGVFDEAAVQCMGRWRFSPATYEGRPVAVRVRQTLRFVLD